MVVSEVSAESALEKEAATMPNVNKTITNIPACETYVGNKSSPFAGKDKPLRKHEPLGRYITTPIFDKNSSGRTLPDGKAYYRPKRDANGIIMCRSQKDQEACIFADKVRDLRQHEYDNQSLYTDSEAEQAAQNERAKCDFIKYFEELKDKRHKNSSKSIQVNWKRELALMKLYTGGKPLLFGSIDVNLIEDYKSPREVVRREPYPLIRHLLISLYSRQDYIKPSLMVT